MKPIIPWIIVALFATGLAFLPMLGETTHIIEIFFSVSTWALVAWMLIAHWYDKKNGRI